MNEETKHFDEIFNFHHDPARRDYLRMMKRKEKKVREKGEDLGLDVSPKL